MAESQKTARIGFQLPEPEVHNVTGYCAAEMAIADFNERGALPFQVELVPVIENRDPERARHAASEFAADPSAIAMLGPINSDMALITQDIYNEAGLAQISSEASSPLLTGKGYKNFFRVVANDEVQGRALAQVAARYLGAQRIAVLSDDSGWGRPIARIFTAEARRLGADIALEFYFSEREEQLEFDGVVQATVASAPDLIYFAVYWNKAHIIAHQLRDRGLGAAISRQRCPEAVRIPGSAEPRSGAPASQPRRHRHAPEAFGARLLRSLCIALPDVAGGSAVRCGSLRRGRAPACGDREGGRA